MATDPNETAAPEMPRRKYPHAPQPGTEGASETAASRGDDPRERARQRAIQLRKHRGALDEGEDDFFVDKRMLPDGWTYEWKRHTNMGAEDPSYQVQIARAGWEAVPVSRHPEMMPKDYPGVTILRKGMILMERPTEIIDEAKAIELRKARGQVRQKEMQLHGAPAGGNSPFDPDNKGSHMVNLKRSYEPMPIPKE
jgi:hypothetical protein